MNEKYHHGNLRNALIEAGIKLIHDEGMQALSIRRVAALCGVSHAAPRHHFSDKVSLLRAMETHITERFTQELTAVAEANAENPRLLHEMGVAYLKFFLDNPYYYNLVFTHMTVEISMDKTEGNNYPPFELFKNCAIAFMKCRQIPEGKWMQNVMAMWAIVHGITSAAIRKAGDNAAGWRELLESIMSENFIFSGDGEQSK